MKALSTLTLALGVIAAGCGDSPSNPSDPPPSNNTTTTTTYSMNLKTSNERPNPVSNAEAGASGTATITLRVTRDPSGGFVSATADFQVSMQGFPAGSTITAAHIHPGDVQSTGGVIVNTGLASGEVTLTNGAGGFQKTGIQVSADVAQGIVNTPANYYFNVHSAMNPGGVIRSQIDGSGVPEDPTQKPQNPNDPYYPVPGRAR